MKKIIKIVFINIVIFAIILTVLNFIINKNTEKIFNLIGKHNNIFLHIDYSKLSLNKEITEKFTGKTIESSEENFKKFCGEPRDIFGENYNNNPIIILGCSYTYGHGLKTEETFPYLLAELTKRPVYNFSSCGADGLSSLAKMKSYNEGQPIKNADYVIYLYMADHISRYMDINLIYNNYNIIFSSSKNKFITKITDIPVIKLILSYYQLNKILTSGKYPDNYTRYFTNSENYLKKVILSMRNEISNEYPNAKIIIIVYNEKVADLWGILKTKFDSELLYSDVWEELKEEPGLTVVKTKDITGFLFDKDYKLKEDIADWHPNAKAWEVFTPKFAKEYIK